MASELLYAGIAAALFFAFWNGFTDAANAISTIVATRVLTPFRAVALSAGGNFLGLYFGGAVAFTIWKGLVDGNLVGPGLVIAALCADGVTEVSHVHHVDRGYPNFAADLNRLGARVERAEALPEPTFPFPSTPPTRG